MANVLSGRGFLRAEWLAGVRRPQGGEELKCTGLGCTYGTAPAVSDTIP
jgi:hypothetical protein